MRMAAQGADGVVMPRKFGFAKRGMDFAVADMMQQHHRPALATAQPRGQVMMALWHIRRDWTVA